MPCSLCGFLEIMELIIRLDSQLGGTICESVIRVAGRRRISAVALFKEAVLSKKLEQKKRVQLQVVWASKKC